MTPHCSKFPVPRWWHSPWHCEWHSHTCCFKSACSCLVQNIPACPHAQGVTDPSGHSAWSQFLLDNLFLKWHCPSDSRPRRLLLSTLTTLTFIMHETQAIGLPVRRKVILVLALTSRCSRSLSHPAGFNSSCGIILHCGWL